MFSTLCMMVIAILAVIFMYNHVIYPVFMSGKTLFSSSYFNSSHTLLGTKNNSNSFEKEEIIEEHISRSEKGWAESRFTPSYYRNNEFMGFVGDIVPHNIYTTYYLEPYYSEEIFFLPSFQ